jgi:cell division transport system permease protein
MTDMTEYRMAIDESDARDVMMPEAPPADALPRFENPIVPNATITSRALVVVIAIMTFLAALTTGAVVLVRNAAGDWQSAVAREVTIQVRPSTGRDIEADVAKAADLARAFPGVAAVRIYSREESARLLEPWLGTGIDLNDLPVPRIIVVRLAAGATLDAAALRKTLTAQVPTATLDDHRSFVARMRAMTNATVIGGFVVWILVLSATVLSVSFATRGAMAANRSVIEVLHFIGAKNGFIAGHFQRRFLLLGLKGGAIGGAAALALFALAEFGNRWFPGTAAADQFGALFGSFAIGIAGYVAVLAQTLLIAGVTALTSRATVNWMLETIQ